MRILLALCLAVLFGPVSLCAGNDRPNVVVIVADDLGYADVGFHDKTAPGVHTPHLDQLAKNGVVFRNAYSTSPICSPSRLGLSTGRYEHRWGTYYYGQGGLPTTEFTIAEMMREAGYRTMKVGKTHLNRGPKEHPLKHGFDHFLGFINHSWDFELLSQADRAAYEKKKPGCTKTMRHSPVGALIRDDGLESFENTTTTELFGDESVKFMETESDKPFYLQLEFNAVHTPLTRGPKQLQQKYGIPDRPFDRNADVWEYPFWDPNAQTFKQWYDDTCHLKRVDPYGRKIYLAHLELMDLMVGQIMESLNKQGVADNTIVFFSSDNGGSNQSHANNGSVSGYKFTLMDGGIRVPMIMSWPGHQQASSSVDGLVTHRDLFATLSEVTGIAPKNPLDGKSLLPLMSGKVDQIHHGPLFWDCGDRLDNWVVRDPRWKLAYWGKGRKYEAYELDGDGLIKPELRDIQIESGMKLFDMDADPGETSNLAQQHPERVAEMKKQYEQWRSNMIDPVKSSRAK